MDASIKYSNEPTWIGSILSIRDDNKVKIVKNKFFGTTVLAEYDNARVSNFKIEDTAFGQSAEKKALGTLGGAAVGGILTGGFGAVVGGMAGGNKTKTTRIQSMALGFDDGKWLVLEFEFDGGLISDAYKVLLKEYTKRFTQKMASPFA